MTERDVMMMGQPTLPLDAGMPEDDAMVAPVNCARCGQPGAGSPYNRQLFHLSCRMEAKREDGLITTVYQKVQPRLRGTGSGKKRGKR